jgi:hypothetical protein
MFQVMASKLTNESTTWNAETHRSSTAIQAVFIEPYKTPKIQIMKVPMVMFGNIQQTFNVIKLHGYLQGPSWS